MHNVGSLEKCILFKLSLCVRNNRSCSRYLPNATIYGFDSFQGLPEDWDIGSGRKAPKEAFDMRGGLPNVMSNVKLVKGFYNDTLAPWLATHAGSVRLLHLDCDLYSSSVTVLETLEPRIVPGSIIVFDELINYPEFETHVMRALLGFMASTRRCIDVVGTPARWVAMNGHQAAEKYENAGGEGKAVRMGAYKSAVVQLARH